MPYRKSLEIEARLDRVLKLIRQARLSTRGLAEEVGVSIPTMSRCIQALRQRGHQIRAEQAEGRYCYVLVQTHKATASK